MTGKGRFRAFALTLCAAFAFIILLDVLGVRSPTGTWHVGRSPDQVIDCLTQGELSNIEVSPLDGGGRRLDVLNGKRSAVATFWIYPESSGSKVEYRRRLLAVSWPRWRRCLHDG